MLPGSLAIVPSALSLTTGLLIIVSLVLLWCVSLIIDLRRRLLSVESLSAPARRPASEAIPAEVVAAISAAVVATFGRNMRIVTMSRPTEESHAWSLEGRRHIFHSHKVR